MPVGAEITTNSGVIQINESFPCLCLRYQGTATSNIRHPMSTNSTNNLVNYVDLAFTATNPIVAISGPQSYGIIAVRKNSATNWTFRVITVFTGSPAAFTYFVYDNPIIAANGAGFEFYSTSGELFFSSATPVFSVYTTIAASNESSVTLQSGRTYAVCFNSTITSSTSDEHLTNGDVITTWTAKIDAINIVSGSANKIEPVITGGSGIGASAPEPTGDLGSFGSPNMALIIDVTEYI